MDIDMDTDKTWKNFSLLLDSCGQWTILYSIALAKESVEVGSSSCKSCRKLAD
jgi:hypothetical protein